MLRLQLSRRLAAAVLLAGLAAGPALALDPVFSEDGLAIRGYDPVAYFNDGRPVEGKDEFTYSHEGTVWRFATAANRDAFAADPPRYAPQYGGYRPWPGPQGHTAPPHPDPRTTRNRH